MNPTIRRLSLVAFAAERGLVGTSRFGPGRRPRLREDRIHGPDAGRRSPPHPGVQAGQGGRAAADHAHADALRHRRRRAPRARRVSQGPGRRRLPLRLPGHPRPVQVRGDLRHDPRPAQDGRAQGHRRGDRRLRHDRLAGQEREGQQRPGGHAGHLLSGLADGHGPAGAAPRAQGRVAPGVAGRHVPGRRLPPQRGVPAQLRLRVRRADGDLEGERALQVRPPRHVRVVSPPGAALERECAVTSRGRSRPGTTSSSTPTTTSSGASRPSRPTWAVPRVPTLNVAGWWDQEDFYGPLKIYETFEKSDPERRNFLVVGPWNHGGWSHGDGRPAGPGRLRLGDGQALPGQDPGALVRGPSQGPGLSGHSRRP